MTMTNEEIVRDYNQASNKSKQIKILADLRSRNGHIECPCTIKSYAAPRWGRRKIYNCCSSGEIKRVLAEAGVAGVKMPERIVPRRNVPLQANVQESSTDVQSIYDRIEIILASLPEDATKYTRRTAYNLVVALFSEYAGKRLEEDVRYEADEHS